MPVRRLFIRLFLYHSIRLCNSVCSSRQWTPELDQEKLANQQAKVLQIIQDQKATAQELKFHTYPSTRPFDWEPTQPDIESEHEDCEYDNDGDGPQMSQRLEHHLERADASGIPPFEALFGSALIERIKLRSAYLQSRKRGRPRKGDKSSSGLRLPGGQLTQQVQGCNVPNSQQSAKGPSKFALESVKRRTGGLVDYGYLVDNNNVPGRVLVSQFLRQNL